LECIRPVALGAQPVSHEGAAAIVGDFGHFNRSRDGCHAHKNRQACIDPGDLRVRLADLGKVSVLKLESQVAENLGNQEACRDGSKLETQSERSPALLWSD